MTGNNTGRAAVVESGKQRFTLSSFGGGNKVLPDVLWNAGYSTALVGIWDEQMNPLNYGYDQWSGLPATSGRFDSYPEVIYLDSTQARLPANSGGGQGVHVGDLLLQESLSWLDRQARAERPCFLHVALPEFEVTSSGNPTDLPANVAELDRVVGSLLDWMDEQQLNNRTCVILMGVSTPQAEASGAVVPWSRTGGLNVHESGLSEGNLRVPLIACWEGRIAAGGECEHVCAAWDVLPTLADLAHVMRRPQRLDGLAFTGALLGRTQPEHRLLYWETREHGFGQAVRMGDWKGVRLPRQTTLSLFDLAADPGEQQDLSGERPEVVEQLVVRE
jgi:arylsulfatase A-like enzyme